jgi:hypothetical protein
MPDEAPVMSTVDTVFIDAMMIAPRGASRCRDVRPFTDLTIAVETLPPQVTSPAAQPG